MDEQSYYAGQRRAANRLLTLALEMLGYKGTEAEHTAWIREREEIIVQLRDICEHYGDNDWPDNLHLGDVIEKHLHRPLAAAQKG